MPKIKTIQGRQKSYHLANLLEQKRENERISQILSIEDEQSGYLDVF